MNSRANTFSRAALSCSGFFWGLLVALGFTGCVESQTGLGLYEASFGTEPPTTILVQRAPAAWVVRNGAERIALKHLGGENYRVPVFGGSWQGGWVGEEWVGVWTDSLRSPNYHVSVTLKPLAVVDNTTDLMETTTSSWDTSEGLLLMSERGDSLWATISTPTGDYRFLAGKRLDNLLVFNTFDGAHLFRIEATVRGDSLVNGSFLSGIHYHTSFEGQRSEKPNSTWSSSTQNPISHALEFSGINHLGDSVSWSLGELRGLGKKGLVLDVMGTWCPNCMDEARLLRELAPQYPEVQFLSLAFERSTGQEALLRLEAFRQEMMLPWDVWLGGRASKSEAAKALSAIDTIHSFPTTVFWPLEGAPAVHNGFNGPATGEGYSVEQAFFRDQLNRISGRSENR